MEENVNVQEETEQITEPMHIPRNTKQQSSKAECPSMKKEFIIESVVATRCTSRIAWHCQ